MKSKEVLLETEELTLQNLLRAAADYEDDEADSSATAWLHLANSDQRTGQYQNEQQAERRQDRQQPNEQQQNQQQGQQQRVDDDKFCSSILAGGKGAKDYEPDSTIEQREKIETGRKVMYQALSYPRIVRTKASTGVWLSNNGESYVRHPIGASFQSVGRPDKNGGIFLTPEETVYMVERGSLELFNLKGLPMSLEETYTAATLAGTSLTQIQVFCMLKRYGFHVQRCSAVINRFQEMNEKQKIRNQKQEQQQDGEQDHEQDHREAEERYQIDEQQHIESLASIFMNNVVLLCEQHICRICGLMLYLIEGPFATFVYAFKAKTPPIVRQNMYLLSQFVIDTMTRMYAVLDEFAESSSDDQSESTSASDAASSSVHTATVTMSEDTTAESSVEVKASSESLYPQTAALDELLNEQSLNDLDQSYLLWRPDTNFRKTSPGPCDLFVSTSQSEQAPPGMFSLQKMFKAQSLMSAVCSLNDRIRRRRRHGRRLDRHSSPSSREFDGKDGAIIVAFARSWAATRLSAIGNICKLQMVELFGAARAERASNFVLSAVSITSPFCDIVCDMLAAVIDNIRPVVAAITGEFLLVRKQQQDRDQLQQYQRQDHDQDQQQSQQDQLGLQEDLQHAGRELQPKKNSQSELRDGCRSVSVAIDDNGSISFLRFADLHFSDHPLDENAKPQAQKRRQRRRRARQKKPVDAL